MTSFRLPFTPLQALAYVTLPGIIPRLRGLDVRFTFVASLMAVILMRTGLLPPFHPFVQPAQYGQYSIRMVVAEAFRHVTWRWSHVDQIIVFFVILSAFILLLIQFFVMIGALMIGVAEAAAMPMPPGIASIFSTPYPSNDIALMLLDRVFGVPYLFDSCVSTDVRCDPGTSMVAPHEPGQFPEPHHLALQSLFAFYSMGALLIGGFLVCYFLGVVLMETVQTGVPFGKRFASFYAPIRLCLAVLMLVPLPTPGVTNGGPGYNAAQYVTLWLAGLGSGFGTNLWYVFNNTFVLSNQAGVRMQPGYGPAVVNAGGDANNPSNTLIAQPIPPKIDNLLQYMMLVQTCRAMYELRPTSDRIPQLVPGIRVEDADPFSIEAHATTRSGTSIHLKPSVTYQDAARIVGKGGFTIRFGLQKMGFGITPFCGQLRFDMPLKPSPGSQYLIDQYFALLVRMWHDPALIAFGDRMAALWIPRSGNWRDVCSITVPYPELWGTAGNCGSGQAADRMPGADYYFKIRDAYQMAINGYVIAARQVELQNFKAPVDNSILLRGWAGAGIWYNKLVETNGMLFDAARTLPVIVTMPEPMEVVAKQRQHAFERLEPGTRYTPMGSEGRSVETPNLEIATGLNKVYLYFRESAFLTTDLVGRGDNAILDLINTFFGTDALFNMRNDPNLNPLVQLTAMGKGLVDQALTNIMVGAGIEFAGGAMQQIDAAKNVGKGLDTIGDAWFTVSIIGLGIGLILFYIVPFMPFLYFFFAVVKWLQSIFEAMIGVPMWALAHLRIDGDGIPGKAAADGYFLLLEILIRPALTIFGMIASFIIFTAMVFTLNDIFDLVMVNLAGYEPPSTGSLSQDLEIKRGTVDFFFYTILYAVLVYMMAISCFKLVDKIPAEILRWMSSEANNIIDQAGDPAQKIIQNVFVSSFGMPLVQQSGQLGQAITGLREAAKGMGTMAGQSLKGSLEGGNKGVQG